MSILIIGSNGSMGRRYQAILKSLEVPFVCADAAEERSIPALAERSDGIIIATPTETHFGYIHNLHKLNKPILCEKPLSKSPQKLAFIKDLVKSDGLNLTMMMQYRVFDDEDHEGPSLYNYFNHGKDGIFWDCIQIIGLARGPVELLEFSPTWTCHLNGQRINIQHMDLAYVDFVKDWLKKPGDDIDEIIEIHNKVLELAPK